MSFAVLTSVKVRNAIYGVEAIPVVSLTDIITLPNQTYATSLKLTMPVTFHQYLEMLGHSKVRRKAYIA